jgi:hypothetical protein
MHDPTTYLTQAELTNKQEWDLNRPLVFDQRAWLAQDPVGHPDLPHVVQQSGYAQQALPTAVWAQFASSMTDIVAGTVDVDAALTRIDGLGRGVARR